MASSGIDANLEAQAQQMAEAALASLPPAARAAKLPVVKEGILKRLQKQAAAAPAAPPAPAPGAPPPPPPQQKCSVAQSGTATGAGNGKKASQAAPSAAGKRKLAADSSRTESRAKRQRPPPPPRPALIVESSKLEVFDDAEAVGDECWFADVSLRQQLMEATIARHAEQKILVGSPANEIRRICPSGDAVLGAGAVLRLGGAHHGGYGESDIKYAYRQLSRALHPDKNPDVPEAPDAFKRLQDASEELKRGIEHARRSLDRISKAVGSTTTPEMLERPQIPLLAEVTKLLTAVVGLSGEGCVPDLMRSRAFSSFQASPAFADCHGQALLKRWYESDDLLGTLGEGPLRIAYDCAPKRFRTQLLSLLSRASSAEAQRNEGCLRGPWHTLLLEQFPEVGLYRDLMHELRLRVVLLSSEMKEKEEGSSGKEDAAAREEMLRAVNEENAKSDKDSKPKAPRKVSEWATVQRRMLEMMLPSGSQSPLPATDRELRLLSMHLWRDFTSSASEGLVSQHLQLFMSDDDGALVARWAYVPASDLLLVLGEGLVGLTSEGFFTSSREPSPQKRFAAALRQVLQGDLKRGLAAIPWDDPFARKAKLNRGPTKIVLLTNLVGAGEVDEDLQSETAEEAEKYGKLKQCIIKEEKGAPDDEAVRIFLLFDKVQEASKCYADMKGRYFAGRTVKAKFYDEERFARGDLERRAASRVLLLTNLVEPEDVDEELQFETLNEVEERFGPAESCYVHVLPTTVPQDAEGVRIFVVFDSVEVATKALSAINGRLLKDREVKAKFYEEARFLQGEFAD